MINVKESLELLGFRAEDRVTGFKGIISSISFDLYGCVQALINPGIDDNGKLRDSAWFDTNRIELLVGGPIMNVPNFDLTKGPENKPASTKS
jgi:hypothetical protein